MSEAASSSCKPSADMLPSSGVALRPGLGICSHHKQACVMLQVEIVLFPNQNLALQLRTRLKPQTRSGKLMKGPTKARKGPAIPNSRMAYCSVYQMRGEHKYRHVVGNMT